MRCFRDDAPGEGSNLQHLAPKASVLPIELPRIDRRAVGTVRVPPGYAVPSDARKLAAEAGPPPRPSHPTARFASGPLSRRAGPRK